MKTIKKKDLRIAMIGCGNIAKFHVEAFNKLGVKILHCASRLNSKTIHDFAKFHQIKNIWNNPIKLAKASKLWDGIILCSKTESVPKLLDILIKQKKPILVEKPVDIGTNYLKKFKKSNHSKVQVGFNRRFYPTIREAKKFVENSKSEILVKMIIPEKVLNKRNKMKKFRHIFENSAHGIDLLFYLFKDLNIINVSKVSLNSFDSSRIAIIKTKNKHTCILVINSNSPDNFSIEIEDGQNRLLLKPFENFEFFKGLKKKNPTKSYPLRRYLPDLRVSKNIFKFNKKIRNLKPGFQEQSSAFIDLILKKKKNYHANLKDAYNTQKLIEKIMLS